MFFRASTQMDQINSFRRVANLYLALSQPAPLERWAFFIYSARDTLLCVDVKYWNRAGAISVASTHTQRPVKDDTNCTSMPFCNAISALANLVLQPMRYYGGVLQNLRSLFDIPKASVNEQWRRAGWHFLSYLILENIFLCRLNLVYRLRNWKPWTILLHFVFVEFLEAEHFYSYRGIILYFLFPFLPQQFQQSDFNEPAFNRFF